MQEIGRLRAALEESESRYRALYENNPTMFFTLATDGTVLSVNRFGARELGYEVEELLGRPVLDVFHPEDHAAVAAALADHLRKEPGTVSRWEFRKVRKTGEVIWVREATRTMRHQGQDVVLVVCDNITSWKSAERELEATKGRLTAMERMAALGTLVSGVAHEIRTPLAIIQTNASILALRAQRAVETGAAPTAQDLLERTAAMTDGVDRIQRLVSDLRRFIVQPVGVHTRTSLDQPVAEAARLFHRTHRVDARFATDLRPTPEVAVDRLQVQQVVINLLLNAVEAVDGVPEGVVRVATHAGTDTAEAAVLVVEDNGPGIPEPVQGRMYEPLFTTKADGTGLGLAIVQRIVAEHGGRIRCRTGPAGTRFEVAFPPPGEGASARLPVRAPAG